MIFKVFSKIDELCYFVFRDIKWDSFYLSFLRASKVFYHGPENRKKIIFQKNISSLLLIFKFQISIDNKRALACPVVFGRTVYKYWGVSIFD